MSNLLKQYYVVSAPEEKRVINYNAMAEERIRSQLAGKRTPERADAPASSAKEESGPAEFSAGILSEEVIVPPQPDPAEAAQQILADAKAQAQKICNDAKEHAQRILEDAQNQAKLLCEEHREIGYREGARAHEEELARLQQQLEADIRSHEEEFAERKEELETAFAKRQEQMEADIVDALIPVFEKVFRIQFGDRREMLLSLAQNVLSNVELGNKLRIRANEADTAMLKEHVGEIRRQVGTEVSLELIQDNGLSDGQCQIETAYGVFDCGIDTHFESLIKDIRTLV